MSENDEFPAICDACCGPDKHIKMVRQINGDQCKICIRPFTVYRWNISTSANKSKKTIICMTCARSKNCCQSCMLDINFGIPIEIRDTALKMAGLDKALGIKIGPSSSTKNKEVKAIMADKQEEKYKNEEDVDQKEMAREILEKLSAKLNGDDKAINSTIMNKKSSRKSDDISNLKSGDISKILAKLPFGGSINFPEDQSIMSFFIFGIADSLPQYLISEYFKKFGKVKSLSIIHRARCGYVTFSTRIAAEAFANSLKENDLNRNYSTPAILIFEDKFPVRVSWGKPKPLGTSNEEHYKLGLVVNKVLRQLSEKDKRYEESRVSSTTEKKVAQGNSKLESLGKKQPSFNTSKEKYKASKIDFEL